MKHNFIYIIISIITFASLFYYSTKYPSTGFISLWLFIEWIILWFKNGHNAKNSFHGIALENNGVSKK